MRKIISVILLICCITLTACGSSGRSESVEQAPERAHSEYMSTEDFQNVALKLVDFVEYDLSGIFSELIALNKKYAVQMYSSDGFDWSQHWDFRELKEQAIKTCNKMMDYDDSKCTKKLQLATDEIKRMAYHVKYYFDAVSKEMTPQDLDVYVQNMCNEINIGLEVSYTYLMLALVENMEDNDIDEERIATIKAEIENGYVYKTTVDSSGDSIAFTNAYGTPITKCVHAGCNHAIATSGDTNCCIVHSRNCFNCGKYIDEDAMFCMTCLRGKTTTNQGNVKQDTSKTSGTGCQYKYFDGTICGASTNKYANVCDSHMKELYDTHQSLIGK